MTDIIGGKPVEGFGEADRVIGKGRELANKLRSLGKFVGKEVRVTVKFRAFSTSTGKEKSVRKVVKMRPSSVVEIRGKYFEVIRNQLNVWRTQHEADPEAFGWYDDISVATSGFSVDMAPPPTKKKATKKKVTKKKATKKKATKKKATKKKATKKKATKKKATRKPTKAAKGGKRGGKQAGKAKRKQGRRK